MEFKNNWQAAMQHIFASYQWVWIAFTLLSLLAACLPVTIFYGLSYLVDHAPLVGTNAEAIPKSLLILLIAMTLALLGTNVLTQVQYLLIDHLRDHIKFSVKHAFLRAVLGENDLAVLENKKTSALLSNATRSFENLGLWIDHLGMAVVNSLGVFFLLLLGFTLNWWIPPLLLLAAIPSAITRYQVVEASYHIENAFVDRYHRLSLQERVMTQNAYFKEVRLFGLKDYLFSVWQKDSQKCVSAFTQSRVNGITKTAIAALFGSAAAAFCTLYFAWSVMTGHASTGSLIIIIGIVMQLSDGLNSLVYSTFRATETGRQVMPLLRLIDQMSNKPKAKVDESMDDAMILTLPDIEVSNVSFVYPDTQEYALKEVSFTIKSGSKIAIVGENGAGKTTLIKLLTGLLQPTNGHISINGLDLATMDKSQYWASIGAVFQDYARFPMSANFNVALGDIDRFDDQDGINTCLERAGLATFTSKLPADEHAIYEELSLSGGQWQRLAMARALFRTNKTKFIILDEPTSALDPNAEHELFERFLELAHDKTTIFVTHRLALAREADMIVVLDQGRVVETGHHEQLLASDGLYSKMFARQASRYMNSTATTQ
ncbi:MAG: ABC transporter ATP-binding protein [Methylotenera sp.]|uniref:ABC transporter ATP-binding protein n=1 Tax=Methylotenera sp. TaxID=2051956 RepID=UPI00273202A8|nr:ABC transporter ATP-binding protein [Methylotenera sp.]MDP1522362.1 ABC transporter ATP-binding protein [Methylotenera sp.]